MINLIIKNLNSKLNLLLISYDFHLFKKFIIQEIRNICSLLANLSFYLYIYSFEINYVL
jgi:hypothetical protein